MDIGKSKCRRLPNRRQHLALEVVLAVANWTLQWSYSIEQLMDQVVSGLSLSKVLVYIDDILVSGKTFDVT